MFQPAPMSHSWNFLLIMWHILSPQIIAQLAAGNGVRRIWVGQNGLMSTPAVSAVIRNRVGTQVGPETLRDEVKPLKRKL